MSADIQLPPCGLLLGNAIYNTCAGYLNGCGYAYTNWTSDDLTPCELADLTVKENQGNLVQFWWFDGGPRPQTKANFLALEDLGVHIPPPDWEHMKNLTCEEFPVFAQYGKERAGLGVLKSLQHCADLGLYSTMIYCEGVNPEISLQFAKTPNFIGYDFGERFTFRFDSPNASKSAATVDALAEEFRQKVSEHVQACKRLGYGRVCCTSSNFYMDYEVAAGVDFTMFEDCTAELNIATALSRGLCRQHDLGLWGSHIANEHYTWLPFANPHRFETLRSQMAMKYMAGAKVIISESGAWHCQTSADGSPQNATPRVAKPLGPTPDEMIQPLMPEVEKCFPSLDHNSPYCRAYRKVMSDFYDFVKANGTPEGQPRTRLAIAKGNYDLCGVGLTGYNPFATVAGATALAEKDAHWYNGMPERGWQIVSNVFFPTPQGIFGTGDKNRLFSGTPWGQVDIVSFAFDDIDADFLAANYKALLFAGWNTCSEKQYQILLDYVRHGGKLFIALPQLSTDTTRNYCDYPLESLVRGGDFSDLCGVKVRGRGPRFYWVVAPTYEPNCLGFAMSRHFGVFGAPLGDIEITDPDAETLLFDHESCIPFLLRHRCGEGETFFLNSWYYPGAFADEQGPRATVDGVGPVGAVWRYLAKLTRGDVYITERGGDDPGAECSFVNLSHFDASAKTLLFNIDFERPHTIDLHRAGAVETVELAPQELRILA